MKKLLTLLIIILPILFYFFGCASSNYNYGWEQVYAKNYTDAISIFKEQLSKDRTNYVSNYGIGVAYYFTNNIDEAIKYLEEANSIKLTNTEIKYYLGLCYEVKKDYKNAIRFYQYYNDKTLDGNYKSEMEKRLTYVIQLQYQEQAQKLIEEEKSIGSNLSDSTVAILSFENRSDNPDYDVLEKGFPTMFITDFSYVPKLKIVERLRMQSILDELKLSQTSLVESGTLQRVGKLLRAKNVIKGGFIISKDNQLRLDLALIGVENGKVNEQINNSGPIDNFYRIEKDMVLDIVGKMGIKVSEQIRQKILTIPTESFFEFLERIKTRDRFEKIAPPNAFMVLNGSFEMNLSNTRLNTLESSISEQPDDLRDEIHIQSLPNPPKPPQK
jgi:tetratricopeptide (TPR) repeat protein